MNVDSFFAENDPVGALVRTRPCGWISLEFCLLRIALCLSSAFVRCALQRDGECTTQYASDTCARWQPGPGRFGWAPGAQQGTWHATMQRTTLKVLPYGAFFPFSWHRADLCCDYYFHDGGRGLANQDWTSLLGGHGLQHAPYNIQHAADHACYVLRLLLL